MSVPWVNVATVATQVSAPAPVWRGVTVIALQCDDDRAELCDQLAEQVRRDAPIRIETVAETATIATLRVIATFGGAGSALSLTLTADRPVVLDDAQGSLTPRRFVAVAGEGTTQFLDRALDAYLPWRGQRGPGRLIRSIKGERFK